MRYDRAIINILKEQINSYGMLLDLLKRERDYLVDIDTEKVEEISKEKDTIVMRLRLLEEERLRLTGKIAEDNGIVEDINLERLGQITGDNTFMILRSQLLFLLQSIDEMNRFNSILIDRSIRYIKATTNFFNLFVTEYNPRIKGVLLSKTS